MKTPNRKILTFGAHPDDIEFGCAPVLLAERVRGAELTLVVCSQGEAGTRGTPEIRRQEAEAAAELMEARLRFLDLDGDARLARTPENARVLAAVIREEKPDVVLAPTPTENQHPDHTALGAMARDAARLARYGGLADLRDQAPHVIDQLFFYSVTNNDPFPAASAFRYDVSEQRDLWRRVMECHASQLGGNRRYIELQETRARLLGLESGCEAAVQLYANDPLQVSSLEPFLSARIF